MNPFFVQKTRLFDRLIVVYEFDREQTITGCLAGRNLSGEVEIERFQCDWDTKTGVMKQLKGEKRKGGDWAQWDALAMETFRILPRLTSSNDAMHCSSSTGIIVKHNHVMELDLYIVYNAHLVDVIVDAMRGAIKIELSKGE